MYLNNPVIQSFGQDPVYIPSTGVAGTFSQSALAADPVIKADMANMKTDIGQLSSLLRRTADQLDYMLQSDEYTTAQISGFSELSSKIMVIGRNYDIWRQQFIRRLALLRQRSAPQQIQPISLTG